MMFTFQLRYPEGFKQDSYVRYAIAMTTKARIQAAEIHSYSSNGKLAYMLLQGPYNLKSLSSRSLSCGFI